MTKELQSKRIKYVSWALAQRMKKLNMKKSIVLLLMSCLTFALQAQDLVKPPVWKISHSPKEANVGETVELVFEATFQSGWHLYGANFDPNCGPIVTTMTFESTQGFELIGKLESPKAKKKYDDIFGCDITYFDKNARFTHKIKITEENVSFKANYECQLCQDDGMCIPFDGPLEYSFKAKIIADKPVEKPTATETEPIKKAIEKVEKAVVEMGDVVAKEDSTLAASDSLAQVKKEKNTQTCKEQRKAGWDDIIINRFEGDENQGSDWKDLVLFMLLAFASGLAALMTPCVFPMIPMTVTFFTKSSKTRAQGIKNALIYSFFIIAIYTIIGVLVSKIAGPSFATTMATHWLPNSIFFIIFILFALSFLGLFEITLPSSFINKMDSQSDRGGLIGIFFMAFTIVLVSFSCTGPIASTVLTLSADGQWIKPIVGMFAYSLAFALPFGLFAAFPGWLNSLPKSGGWLNEVKVTLGFLELAFALKFLSQVDQVENWGILDREVFLSIWIAIFFLIGIYLLGKFRMKSDSSIATIGVFRIMLVVATFSFTTYMVPGLWGAPLKFLSGMLPPPSTQDFYLTGQAENGESKSTLCDKPMYTSDLHLPNGIEGYFDLRQAICCAREQNKPIFLDYTGKACANCREMEQKVWSDPAVMKRLQEDFVVVALYGDYNKIQLPEDEWYTNEKGKEIKTIGKANSDLLLSKFNRQGQPFYILLGVDEEQTQDGKIVLKELNAAHDFNTNIDEYIEFLDKGKENYYKID